MVSSQFGPLPRQPRVCRPVRRASFSSFWLDLVRDRLKRADLFSSDFLVSVQLALVHDSLKRVDLLSSGFTFLVQLDLVCNRLKSADLYSRGFLFLVQLDLVHRSTESCSAQLTFNLKLVA